MESDEELDPEISRIINTKRNEEINEERLDLAADEISVVSVFDILDNVAKSNV